VVGSRLAKVSAVLGAEEKATECGDALRGLRARIGLPGGLQKAGVAREKLDLLADLAFLDACHQLNPRPCSREDLRRLYEASF
jgi:alcohol dehydrogenase class IV